MKKKQRKEYLKILELGMKSSRDDIENAYSHFVKLYSSEDSPEIHPLKEEISKEEKKKILSDIDDAYKALAGEDGVNRIDFSAEFEPQEIILDEEEPAVIEHEEIEPAELVKGEDEPVVEIVFADDAVHEIHVDESIDEINERSEPQVIEFGEDIPDEDKDRPGSIEKEPEIIKQEKVIVDKVSIDADVEITGKYLKNIRESRNLKIRDVGEILNIEYKILVHIESEKFEKLNDPGFLRWLIKSYSKFLGLNEEKSAGDYMRRYRNKK